MTQSNAQNDAVYVIVGLVLTLAILIVNDIRVRETHGLK